jgi:hypothetical protein
MWIPRQSASVTRRSVRSRWSNSGIVPSYDAQLREEREQAEREERDLNERAATERDQGVAFLASDSLISQGMGLMYLNDSAEHFRQAGEAHARAEALRAAERRAAGAGDGPRGPHGG